MSEQTTPLRILFLCTGNSCRSQMAEGWTRALKQGEIEAYSAGVLAKGIDPRAVKVMAEAGVDISNQQSKVVTDLMDIDFDYVITLCGHARETCPIFPRRVTMMHKGFDDPPSLAETAQNEEEALTHYRRVRDEIKAFVISIPAALGR